MKIRNIDYAQSVEGNFRWRPSRVNDDFNDSQTRYGPIAIQVPSRNPLLRIENKSSTEAPFIQSEDCLNLNIYLPKNNDDKLPVMLWIHGGGFQIGSGSLPEYEASQLSEIGKVIIVTINYRLGCFGFLRLVDVTDGKIHATGNEGLGDQITALKWIQQHIHKYGGDKRNVTVFGESAGAMSIACLLASPVANNLFHKAIMQSGAGHTYSSIDKANELAKEFIKCAENHGIRIEDFAYVKADKLLEVQDIFLQQIEIYQQFGILPFSPVIDGELLFEAPHIAISNGCAKHIQILAGTNADEWRFFALMLKQNTADIDALQSTITPLFKQQSTDNIINWASHTYEAKNKTSTSNKLLSSTSKSDVSKIERLPAQELLNIIYTHYWFAEPCHRLLDAQCRAGGQAYGYKLARRSPIESLGCTHIADIGFVFNTTNETFHGSGPRVKALVKEIQLNWTQFAHSGQPKQAWPKYRNEEDDQTHIMLFGHQQSKSVILDNDTIELWSAVDDQLLASF